MSQDQLIEAMAELLEQCFYADEGAYCLGTDWHAKANALVAEAKKPTINEAAS